MNQDELSSLHRDWTASALSVRLLRIKHGLPNDQAVLDIASENNWPERSIKDRIEEETTRALIDRATSAASPNGEPALVDDDSQVAAYGQQVASVVESQRTAVNKGRLLADRLLDELDSLQPPEVDQNAIKTLASAVEKHNPELASHLREHVGPVSPAQKMSFLSRRIGMLRTVSEAHERYIGLERQAWGLDDREQKPLEFDAILTALDAHR